MRRRGGSTEFEVELRDASGDVLASIGEYDVETSHFGLDQRTKNGPRFSIKGGAVGATQIVVVLRDRPTVADYATVRVVHLVVEPSLDGHCRRLGKRAMLSTTLDTDIVTVNATTGETVGVAPGTASIMHVPSGVSAIVHAEGEAQLVDVDIVGRAVRHRHLVRLRARDARHSRSPVARRASHGRLAVTPCRFP